MVLFFISADPNAPFDYSTSAITDRDLVKVLVEEGDGTAAERCPVRGDWNTITLTVPATAISPLLRLGLKLTTATAWTGTVYIDSINWPQG